MASHLTAETLISSVERRAHIPESQVTFQDEDFLALANEEMSMGIVPAMLQFHEEFFVTPHEVTIEVNKSAYSIPSRAIGSKIRGVFYKDSGGNLSEMARINPDDLAFHGNNGDSASPYRFYLQNNNIVLVPEVRSNPTGSLLITYFQRPNQLVLSSRISTITSIDRTTGTVLVDSVPSVFTLSSRFDFIEISHTHKSRAIDITPLSINGTLKILTFTPADLPTDLAVGDQIALAGECNIPQIPDELHSVLAQRVVCRCLEAQGDAQNLQFANAKLQEMELKMGNLIDNRSEGNPQKAVNHRSILRSGKVNRRRLL